MAGIIACSRVYDSACVGSWCWTRRDRCVAGARRCCWLPANHGPSFGLPHAFVNMPSSPCVEASRHGFNCCSAARRYRIARLSTGVSRARVCGGLPSFDREVTDADLDSPAPTPWRLFDLGAATAKILAESPYRVTLLASSGWSRAFLTSKNHYLYPDTPADRAMYDHLRAGNYAAWRNHSGRAVEDSGQQEISTGCAWWGRSVPTIAGRRRLASSTPGSSIRRRPS
jgi:hypothetical protein